MYGITMYVLCNSTIYLKKYNSVFFNMAKFFMYRSAPLISAAYELVEQNWSDIKGQYS